MIIKSPNSEKTGFIQIVKALRANPTAGVYIKVFEKKLLQKKQISSPPYIPQDTYRNSMKETPGL